jgi:ferritin
VKYVLDARGHVAIPAISAPRNQFNSTEEAVRQALEWETVVTSQINDLVKLAIEEADYTTHSFLQWFVNEQLEEVATMDTLLKTVQRAGEDRILHVEEFLARRGGHKAIADGGGSAG